jgi:hypothetical protein
LILKSLILNMTKDDKSNNGPSCACGKTDLYEEWIKLQDQNKQEDDGSDSYDPAGEEQIAGKSVKKNRMRLHAKK